MTVFPQQLRGGSVRVNQSECDGNPKWGRHHDGLQLATGQNLEDAVIIERFFRGGPLDLYNGTFVEMGALDGVVFSNTLLLEHCLGWNGLLIEAQPASAVRLYENRPCAMKYAGGACARPQRHMQMTLAEGTARVVASDSPLPHVTVPCAPLSELFSMHGLKRINFFSLDVEGSELNVLQTIDWDVVQIDVLMVETDFNARDKQEAYRRTTRVRAYLAKHGMVRVNPSPCTTPCQRNNQIIQPAMLGITGSDVYVGNPELLAYDTTI